MIYIDIDETICITPGDAHTARNYANAKPLLKNIEKCNKLYEDGNTIVYWTARGTGSGIDWQKVTEDQFTFWGVKHHELRFGKPAYDIFIDDKNFNADNFFQASAEQLIEVLEEE